MGFAPRTSCRHRPQFEALELRSLLSGTVPPGMSLAQANWFYQNTFAAPASVAPEWSGNVATGDAGSLGADYLAAMIARVNDYRWMAGLPGGVTLDPAENAQDQQTALMIAANDELSDSPSPDWLDYTAAGAQAAAASNLTLGASGVTAIDLYMTDPGSSNTPVGHRRWILYPPTQTMGVGDIPADSNALWVIQPQAAPSPAVTAIAWPPAGFVPAPLMPQRWSLQSNTNADFSHATVAVTQNGAPQTVQILSNNDNEYAGTAIVWDMPFAPAPLRGFQTVYTVSVGNVLINGTPQSFSYTTTSFDPNSTSALAPVSAQVGFLQSTAQISADDRSIVLEVARGMNASQQVSVAYSTSNGTAIAGTNYHATSGTLTFAPGQFYSEIVVPLVANNSPAGGGTFSISLYSAGQATVGPISTVDVTIDGAPIVAPPPPSTAGSPIAAPVAPDPPVVMGALELFQPTFIGHTRQSRRGDNRLFGFRLTFNEPLNAASAEASSNYSLAQFGAYRRNRVVQSVPLHVHYDPAANSVSLTLIGNHPFRFGGLLVLKAIGPNGISNASGAPLAGNTMFTILPKAKGIVP